MHSSSLAGWAGAVMLAVLANNGRAQVAGNPAKPAAVVNGEPISLAEVDAALRTIGGPAALEVPEAKRRQMRRDVLEVLIENLLIQQFLRQNGPRVDPGEVSKHLAELETALRKQNKKLSDYLAENSMTDAQLRLQTLTGLQWRDYTKARVTEADVAQYYKDNKDFFDGTQVRVSHIILRLPRNASPQEEQATHSKLQAIRQDIEAGKISFADAAKNHSQCSTAPEGGDVGFIRRKFMYEESFAKAAFNPQLRVGDMIGIVRTEYGLHLIKLTDRKPGQATQYEKIKDNVRDVYIAELRMNIVARARKTAKIETAIQ